MYQFTKNPQTREPEIEISGWENAISNNPYAGLSDMRNVDNVTIPGEISVAMSTQASQSQAPITNVTVTTNYPTSDSVFTYNGVVLLEINTAIIFSNSGGALPTGISANTAYYILTTPSSTTFTVSATSAGGTVTLFTNNGTGTHSFSTIQIGTPKYYSQAILSGTFSNYILYFMVDSNGRCWVYNSTRLGGTNKWIYMHNLSNEGATSNGNGLVSYKNYLFWFDPNYVNVISIPNLNSVITGGQLTLAHLTTKASWYLQWKLLLSVANSDMSHQAIVGVNDNAIYFCNGVNVGSILTAISINNVPPHSSISGTPSPYTNGEVFNIANTRTSSANGTTTSGDNTLNTATGFFQPTDVGAVITNAGIPTGTYIIKYDSAQQVRLSANATVTGGTKTFVITSGYVYNAQALELPTNDFSTCLAELGTNLLIGGVNSYIYPWDRVSTSYSNAIFLSEDYTTRMVTVNTTTYIFCGYKGRVYQTNGSNVSDWWEIPEYLSNTVNPYFTWTDATFNRNQLYCGFKVTTNSGTTINEYGGLWCIDIKTGKGKLQNIMSYGTYSGYVSALVQFRQTAFTTISNNDGYGLFIGWNNGTLGGIDKTISTPYTTGKAYVVSDMIPVGTYLTKNTPSNMEFKLATPLVTGESVTLYERQNITDAFSLVPITQGGGVGEISGIATSNFQGVQWLQLKAVLTSTDTNPSYVRLQKLFIR